MSITRAIGCLVVFAASTASADPPTKPNEQAGTNESLQKGGDDRPWASGVPQAEQQAALSLFQQGNLQLNDGLFAKAAEQYREALKHWQHPAIHYNLALALMNLDQPIETYQSLQEAIKFGPAPLEKDKFEHAKEYLVLVDKQLADIEVSCDKQGAKVLVDGKEVFTAPGKFAQKVKIGKHTFIAQREGYEARVKAPYIGPGEKFRIELKLYTADELTRYHRKWEDSVWVPWAVMGAGAAIGIASGGMELLANSKYRKFDESVSACNTGSLGLGCSPQTYAGIKNTGDTERTLGYIGYGVAGAAIATGIGLAIINRQQPYQIRAEELQHDAADRDDVTVVPVISPSIAGAMVQGRF
jgi:hypothetical protein